MQGTLVSLMRRKMPLLSISITATLLHSTASFSPALAPVVVIVGGGRSGLFQHGSPVPDLNAGPSLSTTTRLYSSVPEPGPCPECADDNAYWDGSTLFICTSCDHEWAIGNDGNNEDGATTEDDDNANAILKDVNGNLLEQGDMCVLTQDLAKGKLKKGLKVKIRLGDYGDGHDCEATIKGVGTYALKTKFLKKV